MPAKDQRDFFKNNKRKLPETPVATAVAPYHREQPPPLPPSEEEYLLPLITEEQDDQLSLPAIFRYSDSNPITNPPQRDRVRRYFFWTVLLALAFYYGALWVAFELSYFNGVPTISLMLATQPWLSPFLIVFQCIYMSVILALALTNTSSSHVSNDQVELDMLMGKEEKKKGSLLSTEQKELAKLNKQDEDSIASLNQTILVLYLLYFPLFLLIHAVKLTEFLVPHLIIAVVGIVVALFCHVFQYRRRVVVARLFERVHGPDAKPMPLTKWTRKDGNARMILLFGTRSLNVVLWANLVAILFAILSGVLFVILSRLSYESESTTAFSLFEYVLYGMVIFLDSFRMLDVWCSIPVITLPPAQPKV